MDYTLFGNTRNFEDEEFELELLDDAMIDYDVLIKVFFCIFYRLVMIVQNFKVVPGNFISH